MKKSRIFMSLGLLTLAMTAIIAGKANKKFSTYTGGAIYTSNAAGSVEIVSGSSCVFKGSELTFNTSLTAFTMFGKQVYAVTTGTTKAALYY